MFLFLECVSVQYEIHQSNSVALTEWYLNEIVQECELHKAVLNDNSILTFYPCKNLDKFSNIEEARKNILFLNIYYDSLGYTMITETPVYDIITLLSSIGGILIFLFDYTFKLIINFSKGHLGLFVGMSFLSLIEIFEIFIQITIMACKKINSIKSIDIK